MKTLLCLLVCLLCTGAARADAQSLYLKALVGMEDRMAPEASREEERRRLEDTLDRLLLAYAERFPMAPPPRLRLVARDLERGPARSLDSGLILVNPYLSARLPDPVLAGILAHELGHIGHGHGWARIQLAYDSLSGVEVDRLARAMTGQHPLKGSPDWSLLRHHQEYEADAAARGLLAASGLPSDWLNSAILGVADARATESHPSGQQRLVALGAD